VIKTITQPTKFEKITLQIVKCSLMTMCPWMAAAAAASMTMAQNKGILNFVWEYN
jgi:hypothetical protein